MDFNNDMKHNVITKKKTNYALFIVSFLLLTFSGCKKADNFYEKLQTLPQLSKLEADAYKPAYIIGDTMIITGSLQPKNHLEITIGGKVATITKIDSVKQELGRPLDRVYLLIAGGMEGKAREVKITTGGYSTLGASIDVYTPGGPGSFDKSLESVVIKSFTNGGQNIFLHCQNGKGDIYYYSAVNKDLRHLTKDGKETILYDLSGALNPGGVPITEFLAGGVDPQGQHLYFSAKTSQVDYAFCKIDLAGKQLTVLNQSQNLAAPYEGVVGSVKMIVSGIYPDSKGNVYLALGFNQKEVILPNAIVKYNSISGRISYIYKNLVTGKSFAGMPGTNINLSSSTVITLRFSPDENLLYVLEKSFMNTSAIIDVFDLDARIKLNDFSTSHPSTGLSQLDVIAPFSGLQIKLGTGVTPDDSFGYLPMPGKRLQVLLFQFLDGAIIGKGGTNIATQYNFPKWIVFDFTEQRTYSYAPGLFDQNGYVFQPSDNLFPRSQVRDELLNYDEDGNLYATANGKTILIRTQTTN